MGISKKMKTIVLSLATLAMTAGALGTATFAWFTVGTEATATGFDFTATTAAGIQVSTDADTWKSNITIEDFDLQPTSVTTISEMDPVSTVNNVAGGELTFYGGPVQDDVFTVTEDTENFLKFDLYFQNEGADALQLMLGRNSSIIDGLIDNDTSLSARAAFINQGSGSDAATALALTGGTSAYIWEPNSLPRNSVAENIGAEMASKYNYYGFSDAPASTLASTDMDKFNNAYGDNIYTDLVNTHALEVGDTNHITTLPGNGEITKLTIYVWMEGQDLDNNNAASGGEVEMSLYFDTGVIGVNEVNSLTATGLTDTTVTLDGSIVAGHDVTAYIIEEGSTDVHSAGDDPATLDYLQLITVGTGVSEASEITLDAALDPGTYNVVIFAEFTGFVSARTETTLTIA